MEGCKKVYTDTSGKLARESETTVPTVNRYAKLGLLDFVVASNGVRLFRSGQASRVREILALRMANRSHRAG
jgi:DNA-binding transcriptional MerR regulator